MTTFLTSLPADEQVTGSRDPLGLLPLWSELGREAIANVTTVSSDMAGWVTLALGTLETRELVGDNEDEFLGTFLMVEQAIAYARCADKNERTVRGSNEVRHRLRRGTTQVLGPDKKRQILVGQRTTGVWGQVSRPGRRSRVLDEDHDRLTEDTGDRVETLLDETLGGPLRRRLRACVTRRTLDLSSEKELVAALQGLHAPKPKGPRKALLREKVLLAGGLPKHDRDAGDSVESAQSAATPASGLDTYRTIRRQEDLVGLLQRTSRGWVGNAFTTTAVLRDAAVAHAKSQGNDDGRLTDLAGWLQDVMHLEQLLGPLERVFRYLLVPRNRTIAELGREVGEALGPIGLQAASGLQVAGQLGAKGAGYIHLEAAEAAIASGKWTDLVVALVDRNREIMAARGRGAWIRQGAGDRLDVDLGAPDDGVSPVLPRDLNGCWAHGFYLPELHRLVDEIEGIKVLGGGGSSG